MPDSVIVVPYDPQWAELYELERDEIQAAFQASDLSAEFHHIGSTSVPGLAAKPIVDMMIVVASAEDAIRAITPIVHKGYTCFGEEQIPGRIYFHRHSYNPFHLHLYVRGNPEAQRHQFFCAYLRKYPETAQAYAALKEGLAEKFHNDRPAYTEAKTEFIRGIDAKARLEFGL